MSAGTSPSPGSDRIAALSVVCVLAVASLVIAFLGVTPARVSATQLLGDARTPGERAFIASHRGGAAEAPENTIAAVRAAAEAGFDYVEVDVALTSDGFPVLLHDATLDRTTNGHGRLAETTLEQVRALDAGSWFAVEYSGTPVPTAQEFLDVLAESGMRAIVELKGEWPGPAAEALVADVEARGLEHRILVASFDVRSLAAVQAASDDIPRLVILRSIPADVVEAVRQLDARGVVVDRRAVLARPEVVDELHDAGMRVVVYTLNTDKQWDAATSVGVDGIVTDDPTLLSSWQNDVLADE